MQFFCYFFAALCFLSFTGLLKSLSDQNFFLHQICRNQVPRQSNFADLIDSLVCGSQLQDHNLKSLLSDSSLIHLIVVSGSHFLVLLWLARIIRAPRLLQFFLVLFYWVVTGCQAPGLFALFLWSLRPVGTASITATQAVLLSGLGCLLVEPWLISSASLYLSWLCCLTLAARSELLKNKSSPQLSIYLMVNLFGGWLVWSHPIVILLNLTLGAFLSIVLFPFGIWLTLTHFGVGAFDLMAKLAFDLIRIFSPTAPPRPWVWSPWWWFWILGLHTAFQFIYRSRQRNKLLK